MLSGLAFGSFFVCTAPIGEHAGLSPMVIARIASVLVIGGFARMADGFWLPPRRLAKATAIAGVLDAAAVALYLAATHHGSASVVAVAASLYPAATVLLASTLLGERVNRFARVGLVLAVVAVALLALA